MKESTRYWCVVPAAGVGKRMGGDTPKQYLPLAGSTVIQQTLAKLSQITLFESIVLCLSSEDQWWSKLSGSKLSASKGVGAEINTPIEVAPGGSERCDSVLNGLKYLAGRAEANDWVLVHDVARPCVRVSDILQLIHVAAGHDVGGLLAMPVRDTMKRADGIVGVAATGEAKVQETVSRENLWHALTPQMFRYGDLMHAMVEALDASHAITDESSAIEQQGKHPLLVEGHPDNIKITHPQDLVLAELFLEQQTAQKIG